MNREVFLKILQDDLAEECADKKLYDEFIQILVPHVGKQITRRTKLPEGVKLVDGTIGDKQALQFAAAHGMDGVRNFHIRKNKGELINLYNIHGYNTPYSQGTPERIKKLEEILNTPLRLETIISIFEQISVKWGEVKELFADMKRCDIDGFHVPSFYAMIKAAGIPNEIRVHWDDKVE